MPEQNIVELIARVRSGVAKIILERNRQVVGSGTGFLIPGGLATNSHVLRKSTHDAVVLHFDGPAEAERVRWSSTDVLRRCLVHESPEDEHDFAVIRVDEPDFAGRHRFTLAPDPQPRVGESVLFLGYPFETHHLTSHLGTISSVYDEAGTDVFQIDGSVNGGNSGGPLLRPVDGTVSGLVTRANTGLLKQLWEQLMASFDHNIQSVQAGMGGISIGGVDPVAAFKITQSQLQLLGRSIERSANVGIGYAFSSRHLAEAMG